jgi:hypothetical protein
MDHLAACITYFRNKWLTSVCGRRLVFSAPSFKKPKMSYAKLKHGPAVDTYRMAIQKLKWYYSVQLLIW